MKNSVVFFGNGPVAFESLKFLNDHFKIEAVVAKPESGRNDSTKLVPEFARDNNIALHLPATKDEFEEVTKLAQFSSLVGIVVDYGMIIPKNVFESFKLGVVNSHFSLLPKLRGADPITFSLLNSDSETGVSLMKIVEELDEGQLLAQSIYKIDSKETILSLTDSLVDLSNQMLLKIMPEYIAGKVKLFDQDVEHQPPTYSRKLTKQDGAVDWTKLATTLELEVRSFLGWPSSKAIIAGKEVTLTDVEVISSPQDTTPGQAFKSGKELAVVCGNNSALLIKKLKPAGKKEMTGQAFLNGNPID